MAKHWRVHFPQTVRDHRGFVPSVTADTTFYAVFRKPDGRKTYLAFNASKSAISVRFSDGKVLNVAPGSLGRTS